MERSERKTATLTVLLAWAVVTIPLGWGVYQSVVKARPLFQGSAVLRPLPSTPGK